MRETDLLGSLKASGVGWRVTSPRGSSPTTSTVALGIMSATYSAMRAVLIAVLFQAASMCASPCMCTQASLVPSAGQRQMGKGRSKDLHGRTVVLWQHAG